ncbi:MAG: T9SS type A sorting domain-containing protein [Ignavibacteriales bacterium]|nr:T9SS type A sorting domain-containing protein [Ignavibacteriales bacterium]
MRYIIILMTLSICHVSIAEELEYYVSTLGNDIHPGTLAQPWKSIQKAANTAPAGCTVFVRGGVYNEAVTINVSGIATAGYITFRNYPGEQPIVDGTGLTVPAGLAGLFLIKDNSYIIIKGFEIRNYKTDVLNTVPVGIRVQGTAHHVQLLTNSIHNIEHNNTSSSGVDAHGICVYGTSGTQSINNVVIDGNELYALVLGSSESLVVNGNVELFRITNNKIHDSNNIGIDAIGFEGNAPANDQARNGIISGNRVYNIESYGNPAYGTARAADGIYVDGGRDIVIERNMVSNCDIGIELASEHAGRSTTNITMRSNFIFLCSMTGIAIGGYNKNRGSTDSCSIVNNTLYANDTLRWETGNLMIQYDTRYNIFKNNIIYANNQNVFVSNRFTENTGNDFDHNLYYCLPGSYAKATFQFKWKNVKYATLAEYQTASGNDVHSLYGDPKFVSTVMPMPDIHLKAGSPAINAGVDVDSIGLFDIDGDPRAVGTVDIGADEYVTSTATMNNRPGTAGNYLLFQNYPNPFNPTTTISFHLLKDETVRLDIVNQLGQLVKTIVNDHCAAGWHSVQFDASELCSGIYYCRLTDINSSAIKKLMYLK